MWEFISRLDELLPVPDFTQVPCDKLFCFRFFFLKSNFFLTVDHEIILVLPTKKQENRESV